MTDVLVFVPGIMGSELWDADGKVWPGTLKDATFGFSEAKFSRLCAPGLEARDIIRRAVGVVEVYEPWIRIFSRLTSRDTGDSMFREAGEKPTLICAPFDWRLPIEQAAVAVARSVAKARRDHGERVAIHLAAHSMGGLVCRYYLQSGKFNREPGFDRIATFLTFGTPHKGATVALAGAVGQHKAQFLDRAQTLTLVNDPRYPALYQLFPQPGSAVVWDNTPGGRLAPRDVFEDRSFAKALGLTESSLDAAQSLFEILRKPWPRLRTFLFVGTRFDTPTHFLWNGRSATLVRTRDGGDGTVTLQGSVLEDRQIRFTDKNHASLIEADQTRIALQDIFNADGVLAVHPSTTVQVSVGELIVDNRQPVEVALTVLGPGSSIDGTLYLERARRISEVEEGGEPEFDVGTREYERRLAYDGPELTSLHVYLEDVVGPAVFRPVFETGEAVPRRFVGPAFVVKRPEA